MKKIILSLCALLIMPKLCHAALIYDIDINSVWTNVNSNYGDELKNPVEHENGMRTSQMDFTYNISEMAQGAQTAASVYNSEGKLISAAVANPQKNGEKYTSSCRISVPEKEEYSVKTMLWDSHMKPIGESTIFSDSEFKAITRYKVQTMPENGKYKRRATFEYDTYDMMQPISSSSAVIERCDNIVPNSGNYCMKVSKRTASSATLKMLADDADKTSTLSASCYVRNIRTSQNMTFYLQAEIPTKSKTYYVDFTKVSVRGTAWTKISAELDLSKYSDITGEVSFKVMNGTASYTDFYADDFVITSDKDGSAYSDECIQEPVQLAENGKYTIRQTFEKSTFGKISVNPTADYFTSDSITPHSGKKSLMVTNRIESDGTLMIYLDNIDKKSVVNIECWVRNKSGDEIRSYGWQAKIPTAEKNYWIDAGAHETASDKGWKKITGRIDLSKYDVTDTPMLQIVATGTGNEYFTFYADDLFVSADTSGELYDDMTYTEPVRDESISETPNRVSTEYREFENDIPSLKDVYKDYFKIGACIPNYRQSDVTRYGQLIKKHFNSVLSDGLFQMCEILPDSSRLTEYDFAPADKLMDFAVRNGMEDITAHCLVWETGIYKKYCQENGKFKSRDTMLAFLKEYITKVMRHFEGDGEASEYTTGCDTSNWHINAWNVVNEAIDCVDGSGKLQYVNKGAFINCIGTDYVDYAFKYAEETGYDDIELRYNDYNEQEEGRSKAIYTLVKNLKSNGRRVDAVGLQSHYYSDSSPVEGVRKTFDRLSSLGVKTDITELDIQAYTMDQLENGKALYEDGIPKSVEYRQTRIYEDLFKLYKEYSSSIDRVTFWSIDDRYSYFNRAWFNKTEYAGIFDRDFRAKPQYWAIADRDELRRRYSEYGSYADMAWNFEDESDISVNGDNGKWTYAFADHDNRDIKINPEITELGNVSKSCEFGSTRPYTQDEVYYGADVKSSGSTKCAVIPNDSGKRFMTANGMKVSLSDKQLIPGRKYKLTFYVMNNHTSRGIHAKLLPKSETGYYLSHDDKIPWLHTGSMDVYDAITSTHWAKQEIIISPSEADFDSNGYTNLYLVFTRNPIKTADGYMQDICPGEMFYIDDIRIDELTSVNDMNWTFDNTSDYSEYPELGKWTYATRDDHNGYYNLQPEFRYNAEKRNIEYIKRVPGYGTIDKNPDDWSPNGDRCVVIRNAYTYDGARNWPAKMGIKVKLSKEQLTAGKTYKISFYGLTNNAPIGVYFKLRPFGESGTSAYYESGKAIPWIDIYADNGAAMVSQDCTLNQHWEKHTYSFTPQKIDFDENGYTNLWLIAAPGELRYKDSDGYHTATNTPGTKVYIDDLSITEVSAQ